MSINQLSRLYVTAVIAVFVLTVTATIPVSIAQISQENEQEGESADLAGDFRVTPDNPGENTSSDGDGEVEYKPGEGPRPIGNINITQGNITDLPDDEEEN